MIFMHAHSRGSKHTNTNDEQNETKRVKDKLFE
jgi:hypothetical protein